ncbi:MAG: hypothetical protein GY953_24860, partial [bacterium]|nr:hypothetical protein [bacterium]
HRSSSFSPGARRRRRLSARGEGSEPACFASTRKYIPTHSGGTSHPLLERREVATAGLVVVSSDRGLAGGYNSNVIRMAEHRIHDLQAEGKQVRLYTVGEKARAYFAYRKFEIDQAWLGVTDTPGYGDARMIGNALLEAYETESVDSVEVFTTRYVSALTQKPVVWPVLPIEPPETAA